MAFILKKTAFVEKRINTMLCCLSLVITYYVTGSQFIFSNKPKYRLARHLVFWLIFSLQTVLVATRMNSISDFFLYQSYKSPLFFLCSILSVCFFSVYFSIYLLFPFLQKKRYTVFAFGFIGLIIFNCITALVFYVIMRPYMCSDCSAIDIREKINIIGNNGINIASFMSLVALGIKFTKNWYLQQVHNRILARQKITSELKLIKARIQPDFLFDSLQALYHKISADKNQAAEMLLKFSEFLSYTLYECNDDFILVQRELFFINEFIALENMMKETKPIVTYDVTGDISKKYIPSFILLSLIQNCVVALHGNTCKEPPRVNIEIYIEAITLYSNMHVQAEDIDAIRDIYPNIINAFINRLEIFYKNNYKLGFSREEGKYIITMSLLLLDNFSLNKIKGTSETGYIYAHV